MTRYISEEIKKEYQREEYLKRMELKKALELILELAQKNMIQYDDKFNEDEIYEWKKQQDAESLVLEMLEDMDD
jgi:hypothetical protein